MSTESEQLELELKVEKTTTADDVTDKMQGAIEKLKFCLDGKDEKLSGTMRERLEESVKSLEELKLQLQLQFKLGAGKFSPQNPLDNFYRLGVYEGVVNGKFVLDLPHPRAKWESVYVRLTYNYLWPLSFAFDPIMTAIKLEWCKESKSWTGDVANWIKKHNLAGCNLTFLPLCKNRSDGRIESLGSTSVWFT